MEVESIRSADAEANRAIVPVGDYLIDLALEFHWTPAQILDLPVRLAEHYMVIADWAKAERLHVALLTRSMGGF